MGWGGGVQANPTVNWQTSLLNRLRMNDPYMYVALLLYFCLLVLAHEGKKGAGPPTPTPHPQPP